MTHHASDDRRSGSPRVPELSALLADLDELRLVLSADLGFAAAALEDGAVQVAADLVDSERQELAAFSVRATRHLAALRPAPVPAVAEADAGDPATAPAVPAARTGRRWSRRLAPLAPALAAAAALVSVLGGLVPGSSTPASPGRAASSESALAGLFALPPEAESDDLREAAAQRNAAAARLLAAAPVDPSAAAPVLAELEAQVALLGGLADDEGLRAVLVQSQRLLVRLRAALPPRTTPRVEAVPVPLPAPLPTLELQQPSPLPRPTTEQPASAEPGASPTPSSSPPAAAPDATTSSSTSSGGSMPDSGLEGLFP